MSAERLSGNLRARLEAALGTIYVIDRELGGGGMSRVFVAQEVALGRDVVVKIVAPELREELSAERFAREVQLAARLQQANIVPVLNAGDADGMAYYTMPYVDGQSLRARIARGPLPLGEALDVLRDVARALAYAHAQGIVHRDIKPENVLLSSGTAVVTDFGIAKALSASRTTVDGARARATALTQAGTSLGTPAYMAPEQALGEEVDARTDLYAWGVIAYELLAGAHPFAGHATAQRLVAAHLSEMPAPLPTDVPTAVAELVMQCLAKDPAARPAGATELLARLSAAVTPGARPAARVMQNSAWMGYLLAATGDRAGATAFLADLDKERGHNAFANVAQAWTYLGGGDTTQALEALERARRAREPIGFSVPFGMPTYDAIRHSGRFAAVIKSYGLEPATFRVVPGEAKP
jgi:serine/threonine-protein kinase